MGDLGKLIVAKGFKKLPKVQKIATSGHTAHSPVSIDDPMALLDRDWRTPKAEQRAKGFFGLPNIFIQDRRAPVYGLDLIRVAMQRNNETFTAAGRGQCYKTVVALNNNNSVLKYLVDVTPRFTELRVDQAKNSSLL